MRSRHQQAIQKLSRLSDKQRRNFRIKTFQQTRKILQQPHHTQLKQPLFQPNPFQIPNWSQLTLPSINPKQTSISVIDGDCVQVAYKLQSLNHKPLLLNMASDTIPGGGVSNGAGAQQENLFRRSDYYRHLNKRLIRYPLPHSGGVYTPNVLFLRGSEADGYPVLNQENQRYIDCIAVSALKRPDLVKNGDRYCLSRRDSDILTQKIRLIFAVGAVWGHDSLVLSAFGCGAYRNPPRQVALNFRRVIQSAEFIGRFQKVVFAIFDDHNANKSHNPQGNLRPFSQVFEVPVISLEELI